MPGPYWPPSGVCELDEIVAWYSSHGFALRGEEADGIGYSVAGVGDVNGDGLSDFIVGATDTAFLIFGTRESTTLGQALPKIADLVTLGKRGVVIGNVRGPVVSAAGDFNGDGVSDFMIGCAGKVSLIFGSQNRSVWESGAFNLSSLDGKNGFVLQGTVPFGFSVSSAGDINGDGLFDIILGDPSESAVTAYVIFGSRSAHWWCPGLCDVSTVVSLKHGFILRGEGQNGVFVCTAGDFNDDGFSDLLLGVPNETGLNAYVLFGSATLRDWGSETLNLTQLSDGESGFVLQGSKKPPSNFVSFVSSAGAISVDVACCVQGRPSSFTACQYKPVLSVSELTKICDTRPPDSSISRPKDHIRLLLIRN